MKHLIEKMKADGEDVAALQDVTRLAAALLVACSIKSNSARAMASTESVAKEAVAIADALMEELSK